MTRGAVNWDVFITRAATGSGGSRTKSDKAPVMPRQIADACVEAAQAGAAMAHAHVRDPDTGAPAREPDLYREVVARVRASGTDVVLNLTAGVGAALFLVLPKRRSLSTWNVATGSVPRSGWRPSHRP